ncbi:MAG: hypothetical protein HOQ45_15090 [Nocardioidaceae bacterium]|nr:hypothetical protein [Nocardioidaceae bacterium]
MKAARGAPDEGRGIDALFTGTPVVEAHTSAAAESAFLLGLVALVAAPFAVMHAIALGVGALAAVLSLVGMATTSRPGVAGRALVPLGLCFAVVALALVGLRYLGLDTAFGDRWLPTLAGWLEELNARFPLS